MMHDANTKYGYNGSVRRKMPAIHNEDGASMKYWKKTFSQTSLLLYLTQMLTKLTMQKRDKHMTGHITQILVDNAPNGVLQLYKRPSLANEDSLEKTTSFT